MGSFPSRVPNTASRGDERSCIAIVISVIRKPEAPLRAFPRGEPISSSPGVTGEFGPLTGTAKASHAERYPNEMSAIPATTATAPASRSAPIFSRPVIARNTVAMTTLDSRTAATEAAGASLSAASASA